MTDVADPAVATVAVALTAKPGTEPARAKQGTLEHGPELLPLDAGEQYRFAFDMNACIGCHSCEVACGEQNGLPPEVAWRRVGEIEGGEYPVARRFHLSMSCNHCLEPACLEGCPTNAYEKLANGVVAHHADDCIGCQYCTWNCPYSVPAFQADRRIVTKCDMCLPRLEAGRAPACVTACPTNAITVEKVRVDEWRADPSAGDGPELPPVDLTLSTTRIVQPVDVPDETYAASDWNLRPEHPHWSLVWLTLISQLAVGVSATASSLFERGLAAGFAGTALVGALFHLGRPVMAWKALRNIRRSWLSREVAFLSLYALLALPTVLEPALTVPTVAFGVLGMYSSARLYIVPGRPAWNTQLTVVRFVATAAALGPLVTGHGEIAAIGAACALAATVGNWWRLQRNASQPWRGAVRLETRWFRRWTLLRFAAATMGIIAALTGWLIPAFVALALGELLGRWLFFVAVVPLNMPGSFWRGTGGRR